MYRDDVDDNDDDSIVGSDWSSTSSSSSSDSETDEEAELATHAHQQRLMTKLRAAVQQNQQLSIEVRWLVGRVEGLYKQIIVALIHNFPGELTLNRYPFWPEKPATVAKKTAFSAV